MEAVISKIDWWAFDTTCADELLQTFSSTVSKIVLANRHLSGLLDVIHPKYR
jgi:hypothetical protein